MRQFLFNVLEILLYLSIYNTFFKISIASIFLIVVPATFPINNVNRTSTINIKQKISKGIENKFGEILTIFMYISIQIIFAILHRTDIKNNAIRYPLISTMNNSQIKHLTISVLVNPSIFCKANQCFLFSKTNNIMPYKL